MSDEIVQLRITEVAYGGRGVARDRGLVVFVPGTLPCELVLARIEARHKSYAEARLVKVLEPSPFRTAGDCALCDPTASPTARCAGCCYQHVLYEEEVRLKQTQLKILLERLGKIHEPPCLPPLPAPSPTGYRNKLALHAVWQADRIVIGYVAEDNRTVIEVEKCALASPALNRLLAEIRCRRDVLRLCHSAARIVLRHAEQQGATWWWAHEAPKECFVEETTLGPVEVPAGSFFQVNPAVANLLVGEVTQLIEQVRPEQVLDLHCGVGIFALAAARAGVPAWGIDQDSNAIGAARRIPARLG
ncbi:MAG: class I SAM-dependent RNA methyltransferase, partial [Kiritimatiellia bacterium]